MNVFIDNELQVYKEKGKDEDTCYRIKGYIRI